MTANLKKATKTILNGLRRFFFLVYYLVEHVLLLFGGARGIMQATQFMIDEEINNLRVNE